jgi:cytochrome c biogenesis protein CcmG/thiol:disulfide interchange protein DsbE
VGIGTLVFVGVLVLAAIAVFATIRADTGESPQSDLPPGRATVKGIATRGSTAPDFDLPRLRGPGRVKLADLAGRPVIVNFWASYCFPCRKEFPLFRKAQAEYRRDGLQIVGITFRDLTDDARAFAKQQRATWDLVEGGENDPVARAYGVRALPQTFFIDRDGVIVARYFGAPSGDTFDDEVRKIIRS